MISLGDRGSHIDADLTTVAIVCAAVLTLLVAVKAFLVLRKTQWWEDHSWPLHLVRCRVKAAARVLVGRAAWTCGMCGRPVAVEHDVCRGCVLDMRDAWRYGDRVYNHKEDGL